MRWFASTFRNLLRQIVPPIASMENFGRLQCLHNWGILPQNPQNFKAFIIILSFSAGERYDFVINADQPVGAYWIQLRGLGECGIRRAQQLAILRYARGPYQPDSVAPTYDIGLPQGVVSRAFCR